MEVHTEARLEIEWKKMEMAFNTSGPVEGYADDKDAARRKLKRAETCANVCTLDDGVLFFFKFHHSVFGRP